MRYLAIALMLISSIAVAENKCYPHSNGIIVLTQDKCAIALGEYQNQVLGTHEPHRAYGLNPDKTVEEACWFEDEGGDNGSSVDVFPTDKSIHVFNPARFGECHFDAEL